MIPNSTQIISPPSPATPSGDLVGRVLEARANVSIVHHQVAIRRPLAHLVEATIEAACNSPHTARYYRLGIGKFIRFARS